MHWLIPVAAGFVVLVDMQNIIAWWRGRVLELPRRSSDDYTVLVPVYGHRRFFESREHLESYKSHIIVLLGTAADGMDAFGDELEADGWRVHRDPLSESAVSPRLIARALHAGIVKTTYVLRMDADTRPVDDLGRMVAAMDIDGAAICSVKVYVNSPVTQCQKYQALEYRMAMQTRHYRALSMSGACYIAKTSALREILSRHSYWWAGEDFETGRAAYGLGKRIRHINGIVLTDAPETWRALFKQRSIWWAANFRAGFINFDKNLVHMPWWTFYYVAVVWLGIAVKWGSLPDYLSWKNFVVGLVLLMVVYAAITVIANWHVRQWRMLVYPPYAFAQVTIMPIAGAIHFWRLSWRIGSLGRYAFGYRRAPRQPVSSLARSDRIAVERAEQARISGLLERPALTSKAR
jgi:cellulose synthase/poly-beta-1,6-N-acetylglucosamine synthase-like glycosyltransferase